jgi:integrase
VATRDTADLVEFMGLAGVGQTEAANLRGEHIDFKRGEIHLFRQKTRTAFVVPLYPQVRTLLERLRARSLIKVGQSVIQARMSRTGSGDSSAWKSEASSR